MRQIFRIHSVLVGLFFLAWSALPAQDWPQWMGPTRDGKAHFDVPQQWPEKLTEKWKTSVGNGVATPALVGDRLFVASREGGNEVVRCLDAGNGKEIWKDEYASEAPGGPARGFPGPRSSPAVADGKVVTLSASGILSCFDAESGKLIWRNEDHVGQGNAPQFFTSSSPLLIDGMCISQYGSENRGGVLALELNTGKKKWDWSDGSTRYGSPALMDLQGTQVILAPTGSNVVLLEAATGKMLGEIELAQGRYNAATPLVDQQTVIVGGPNRGMTAVSFSMKDGKVEKAEAWRNTDEAANTQYNTPIVKNDLVFGLSAMNQLFCINTKDSKLAWSAPVGESSSGGAGDGNRGGGPPPNAQRRPGGDRPGGDRPGGQGRRGGGGGGRGGYGSIVDAGSVLFCLTPAGELIAFRPSGEAYESIAKYKVASGGTYAFPVIAGNRIFVKDEDSVTLWTVGN